MWPKHLSGIIEPYIFLNQSRLRIFDSKPMIFGSPTPPLQAVKFLKLIRRYGGVGDFHRIMMSLEETNNAYVIWEKSEILAISNAN